MFIDTVYQVLSATDARTIFDLRDHLGSNLRTVMRASKGLDPEMRHFMVETFKMLVSAAGEETRKVRDQRKTAVRKRRHARYTRVDEGVSEGETATQR